MAGLPDLTLEIWVHYYGVLGPSFHSCFFDIDDAVEEFELACESFDWVHLRYDDEPMMTYRRLRPFKEFMKNVEEKERLGIPIIPSVC